MSSPTGDNYVTSRPFIVELDDVRYRAYPDGSVDRQDGDEWVTLEYGEGLALVTDPRATVLGTVEEVET